MTRPWVAKVDYMACRSKAEVPDLVPLVGALFSWTGQPFGLGQVGKGFDGFRSGAELLLAEARVGRMDWGGEAMCGWVRIVIEGKGCEYVDWAASYGLQAVAQLRRCDPCITWFDGSMTHEQVEAAYLAGGFNPARGGRGPKARQVLPAGDPWGGRTFYVGAPAKGQSKPFKFARCYEKGLEVLVREGRVPEADANPTDVLVNGVPARDVYRIEVEFNAQEKVPLPWVMVHDPLGYWSGAYPWLGTLLDGASQPSFRPSKPEPSTDLPRTLAMIKHQFGDVLYTALCVSGGDIGAVFSAIVGERHSERMLRAGALLALAYPQEGNVFDEPFAGIDRKADPGSVRESIRDEEWRDLQSRPVAKLY